VNRWQNQEEAFRFAMSRPAVMLAMDMGTGKTRVAIDVAFARTDVFRVLVVCPKAVLNVWPRELVKHVTNKEWACYIRGKKSMLLEAAGIKQFIDREYGPTCKKFVVVNYDSVWRGKLGDTILKSGFDMVILDESHRAKSAGSKVSRFLALLGRHVKYKLCLSGTPMANSPLDVYGQYRFLDPTIFGTNYSRFLQEYAVMGGPERRFIVGYKNMRDLNDKFKSIAYQCSMSDVSQRLKLPISLPPTVRELDLPTRDMRTLERLSKEFIAECNSGMIVVNNVLTKVLRMQQIAAGFCTVVDAPGEEPRIEELNTAKEDALLDYLGDIDSSENVVVFCQFKHDLEAIHIAAMEAGRECMELSGAENSMESWKGVPGAILAVQIQAGAEGVDMTCSNHAVYFTLPHSLALYEQSKARLYRPGQTRPVSFVHLIANSTIDELMYDSLMHKRDLIDAIREGTLDYGILKK